MIIAEMGHCTFDGTEEEVLAEAMCILGIIYSMLADNHGKDYAREKVSPMGELAVLYKEKKTLTMPNKGKKEHQKVN